MSIFLIFVAWELYCVYLWIQFNKLYGMITTVGELPEAILTAWLFIPLFLLTVCICCAVYDISPIQFCKKTWNYNSVPYNKK